jgi:hypothetical protein
METSVKRPIAAANPTAKVPLQGWTHKKGRSLKL